MATKYVLVDFENVQLKNVGALNGSPLKVKVFLGASQGKVPLDIAQVLQPFGPDAEYIRIEGNGSNALDFHIAFYVGRLAAQTPGAEFLIISNDKGFDPLIRHVNQIGIACRRAESIPELVKPAQAAARSIGDPVGAAIEKLAKGKVAKPRTLKKLRTWLKALFANQLGDEAIEDLIQQLRKRKVIQDAEGKIEYQAPS